MLVGGGDRELFPKGTKFFDLIPEALNQLNDIYHSKEHLDEIADEVTIFDQYYVKNSGFVLLVDKNGKLAAIVRLTKFNKMEALESTRNNHFDWANLFFTGHTNVSLDLPHLFRDKPSEKEKYLEKVTELLPEIEELYAELADEATKLAKPHDGVIGEDFRALNFLGFFNHLPRAPFIETLDDRFRLTAKEELKRHPEIYKRMYESFKIAQDQIFACANVGIPVAKRLKEKWIELYPPNWFDAYEMGRFWVNPKLGNTVWIPIFSGLSYLTRFRDLNASVYSLVIGEKDPDKLPWVSRILNSLTIRKYEVSKLKTDRFGFMHHGSLKSMIGQFKGFLEAGDPWIVERDPRLPFDGLNHRKLSLRNIAKRRVEFQEGFSLFPTNPFTKEYKRLDLKILASLMASKAIPAKTLFTLVNFNIFSSP